MAYPLVLGKKRKIHPPQTNPEGKILTEKSYQLFVNKLHFSIDREHT